MPTSGRPHVVVLTPVRDEAANLPRFLATTLLWADRVIIADQGSTDGSTDLARSFPGVTVIGNPATSYGEGARQRLLLDAARQLTPMPRLLVALDADEILSADVLTSGEWERVLGTAPGTSVRLARVELSASTTHYFRHWWTDAGVRGGFAYMDDGAPHAGTVLHSDRLPEPVAPRLPVDEVVVLHYARASPRRAASRDRWYQCYEHLHMSDLHTDVGIRRRYDWVSRRASAMSVRPCPPSWTAAYADRGIDLTQPAEEPYFWTDWDILRMLARHGTSEFRFLDIWDVDWEAARVAAVALGVDGVPQHPIRPPKDPVSRGVRWFLERSTHFRWRGHTDAAVAKTLGLRRSGARR